MKNSNTVKLLTFLSVISVISVVSVANAAHRRGGAVIGNGGNLGGTLQISCKDEPHLGAKPTDQHVHFTILRKVGSGNPMSGPQEVTYKLELSDTTPFIQWGEDDKEARAGFVGRDGVATFTDADPVSQDGQLKLTGPNASGSTLKDLEISQLVGAAVPGLSENDLEVVTAGGYMDLEIVTKNPVWPVLRLRGQNFKDQMQVSIDGIGGQTLIRGQAWPEQHFFTGPLDCKTSFLRSGK